MAITIHINRASEETGNPDERLNNHIDFFLEVLGFNYSHKIIFSEDNSDDWCDIYFYNANLNLADVMCLDELGEYGSQNEFYIIIYDHNTKVSKGFWFDEGEEWHTRDPYINEEYENNIP